MKNLRPTKLISLRDENLNPEKVFNSQSLGPASLRVARAYEGVNSSVARAKPDNHVYIQCHFLISRKCIIFGVSFATIFLVLYHVFRFIRIFPDERD